MVMLQAAFDCSKDQFGKYFVMAGFVSSAERWAEFDAAWRKRLVEDGLAYFHMAPFTQCIHQPTGPFDQTWVGRDAVKENRRRKLIADLLDLIRAHAWKKVACILPTETLSMFSEVSRESFVPTLIATAGRLVWSDVEVWRRRDGFSQPARMIFEDGDKNKGTLIEALQQATGRAPIFEPKKDNQEKGVLGFTPLHAADILAYETQKLCQHQGKNVSDIPFRYPYVQLEKIHGDIRILRPDGAKLIDEFMQVQKYFDKNPLGGPVQ